MRPDCTLFTLVVLALAVVSLSYADPRGNNVEDVDECDRCTDQVSDRLFSSQSALLRKKLDQIIPGRPTETDVYFLGFAGNGNETVFENEVRFAEKRIAEEYFTAGRSAVLASSIETTESEPIASTENLFRSIAALGDRMNLDDDIIFLFLTSHGWKDGTLQVALADLPLESLRAADLRTALDGAGIRWRIIVISACYSGSFIDPLKTTHSVIVTAASAETQSHGCAPDNDLTEFGRALFEDAFGSGDGLLDDFRIARSIVAKREERKGLTPSRPQTYVGFQMKWKLEALSRRAPR